jgi:transcriptional regulator with XRE-family HTH domain
MMQDPTTAALEPYQRIRLALQNKGMNQTQLAEEMGVTRAAVSAWLNRDAERRTPIGKSSLNKMAKILHINPNWVTGDSPDGGVPVARSAVEQLNAPQLPSVSTFISRVRRVVLDERLDLDDGFEHAFIRTLGHDYDPVRFDFNFVSDEIVLSVDIHRNKTTRHHDTLAELLWPLLMAKRVDEINCREKRRYQLILINPIDDPKEVTFAHQARMLGIEVALRDDEDVKSIANLIVDPQFKDGLKRWPKELLDYQAAFAASSN